MIAEGSPIVKIACARLPIARPIERPVPPSVTDQRTSDGPLDVSRFVRYLLAVLPRAVTRGEQQPDAQEEVV